MSAKRTSMRDRNRAAIAGTEPATPSLPAAERDPETIPAPVPSSATPAKKSPAKPVKKASKTPAARLGVYQHAEERNEAKAAFLADWQAGEDVHTFQEWVAKALTEHVARTPQQRQQLARPSARKDFRGSAYTYPISRDVLDQVEDASTSDTLAGNWTTKSRWAGDAITAAAARARQRAGGHLPEPPAQLPNRLPNRK